MGELIAHTSSNKHQDNIILLKIVPLTIIAPRKKVEVLALFDQASTVTNELELEGQ